MQDTLNVLSESMRGGYKVESCVSIGEPYYLSIVTMKRSNGRITTTATRMKEERGMSSFVMFEDFNKTVAQTEQGARATAKAVMALHKSVDIEAVKAECAAFYAAMEAKTPS